MITTFKIPYEDGELRIGWASWDNGKLKERSIKYAYQDCSGKISRGAPEISFGVLAAMYRLAVEQGEISVSEMDSDAITKTKVEVGQA